MLPDERDDMKIEIIGKHHGDIRDVLADACGEFARRIASDPALDCDPSWPAVRLVLSGDVEASEWGCDGAVGYFAVIAAEGMDEDGKIWFTVNERLEAHINLDVAVEELAKEGFDTDFIASWLATVPHELLHVRDWMVETGGLVPVEVFERGKGEHAVVSVMEAIERRHAEAGADVEDAVENAARRITWSYCDPGMLEDLSSRLSSYGRPEKPR